MPRKLTRPSRLLLISLALLGAAVALAPRASRSAAAQAPAHTVRFLPLPTNDLVYDAATQRIYASVPSGAGAGGNSITPINPALSTTGAPVFVGSEPARMAPSDDGQFIYVGLNGAGAVRRFNVAAQAPDLLFHLGSDPSSGPYLARDIAVMPGSPGTVAVSRLLPGNSPDFAGVALYDEGVRRPAASGNDSAGHGSLFVEFSASPSTLYGSSGTRLQRLAVTPEGLSVSRSAPLPAGDPKLDAGLLYSTTGQVINPETETVVGTYDLQASPPALVLPDPSADRVYFVVIQNGAYVLRVFEKQSFRPVGSLEIGPSRTFFISSLIRWGTHGLAFRTESEVVIIQTPLVPSAGPLPAPPPAPTPTPTPTPVPTPGPGQLHILQLPARDLVVDPRTQTIYASVGSSGGAAANSITPVDPAAGAAGPPVPVGSEPNRMTITDDGRLIYVGLDGAGAVRRFDVDARTPGLQFGINVSGSSQTWRAHDIAVVPGRPESVAVSRGVAVGVGSVAIYDDGVQRPATDPLAGTDVIEFSANPAVLYGHVNEFSSRAFKRLVVAPCGVGAATSKGGLLSGFVDFKLDGGLVYATSGQVVDPLTETRLGRYAASGPVAPDSRAGRVYFVTRDTTNGVLTLRAFDRETFLEVGALRLPGASGEPLRMVRWGANGVAFTTETGQLVIVESPLVAAPAGPPAPAAAPPTPTLSIRGTVTEFSNPLGGVSVTLGGSQAAAATTDAAGRYSFGGLAPCGDFTVTPSAPHTSFTPPAHTFAGLVAPRTADFNASVRRFSLFGQTTVGEGGRRFVISVLRSGDASGAASIDYATSDGTASGRADYTVAVGTLRFAPGETSKPISVFITNDARAEPPETLTLTFSNAVGAMPPPLPGVTLTINSDDAADGPSPVGEAAFDPQFFVRQHYVDFLGREPDAAGLDFWAGQTSGCGSPDPRACRVNVSAAFFLSIEFQETGYLAYRVHKAAYGDATVPNVAATVPVIRLRDFLADAGRVGRGVQVGVGDWQRQLEDNKNAYALEFVQRPRFAEAFPDSLTAGEFVSRLDQNAGGVLSAEERAQLVAALEPAPSDPSRRAQALRAVAEHQTLRRAETRRAFVLMQYFGYLRRDADDTDFVGQPDPEFRGFRFWLSKLNDFDGDFVRAEMVRAFIESIEYSQRFGH